MLFYRLCFVLILLINGSDNIHEKACQVELLAHNRNLHESNLHPAIELVMIDRNTNNHISCDFCQHFVHSPREGLYMIKCRVVSVQNHRARLNNGIVCHCCENCLNSVRQEKYASTNAISEFVKLCSSDEPNTLMSSSNCLLPLQIVLVLQKVKHKYDQPYDGIFDANQIYEFELICKLIMCKSCKKLLTKNSVFGYCTWNHMKKDIWSKVKQLIHKYWYISLHHISRVILTMILVIKSGIIPLPTYDEGEHGEALIIRQSSVLRLETILVDLGIIEIVIFISLLVMEKLLFVQNRLVVSIISSLVCLCALLDTGRIDHLFVTLLFLIYGVLFIGVCVCWEYFLLEFNNRAFWVIRFLLIYSLVCIVTLIMNELSVNVIYALHVMCLHIMHLLFLFSSSDVWMNR